MSVLGVDVEVSHKSDAGSSRAFVHAGALVLAGSLTMSVAGFAFHAWASRRLGVSEYGSLYALISAYTLAILPAGLFGPVVTKYAAEFGALHDDRHVRGLVELVARVFGVIGIAYVLASFALAAPIANFLHVAPWEIPLVGLISAAGLLSAVLRSIGQGAHEYGGYAISTTAEGLGKLSAVLALSIGGLTLFRGLTGYAIGVVAGLIFMAWPLVRRYLRIPTLHVSLDWKRIGASMIGAAAIAVTMALMGTVDIIIVKHVFTPHEAGLYSAASLSGKILLYFVGFIPIVLIPQATHRHARGERTRHTLLIALAAIAIISACGVIAYRLFGLYLLHALYGHTFDEAITLLPAYATAMALLAGTNALASYGIATHRLLFSAPLLLATGATFVLIATFHQTPATVVNYMVWGNVAVLLSVAIPLTFQGLRAERP